VGKVRAVGAAIVCCACAGLCSAARAESEAAAAAEVKPAPHLRVELWGGDTFNGHGEWLHDAYFAAAIEYEWMLFGPISMGLRALPALAYMDTAPIVGTAVGITNRLYLDRDGTGLYAGPAVALVGHYGRFQGNSSYFNFLSSFELGWQFDSPLRISVKLEHLSNANTAKYNRGWNGVSLMFGWQIPLPGHPTVRAPDHP
jgi:hypothetical protein